MSTGSLLGEVTVMCGAPGVGKSTEAEKMMNESSVILDWHGDYTRKKLPGKKFSRSQVKEFIDYCSNPNLRDVSIFMDEAENYYHRNRANPFGIEKIKINWILSDKGPHHRNLHVVLIYHALPQIPDDILPFYDWFFLYEQNSMENATKDIFKGSNIMDAYYYYQSIWNNPDDKISITRANGQVDLVKPPFIFKKGAAIPKPILLKA